MTRVFPHDDGWSKEIKVRRRIMTKDNGEKKITIDDVEYKLEDLSDSAREQLTNIQFVDAQLQQLNNEWAVSDTARIGYTNSLKAELSKIKTSE